MRRFVIVKVKVNLLTNLAMKLDVTTVKRIVEVKYVSGKVLEK